MNAIEAAEASQKGRVKKLAQDITAIEDRIKTWSGDGLQSLSYDVSSSWAMPLVMHHFRDKGFKVKRSWFGHAAYNTIEVSW